MINPPTVTVLMPVYNGAKYLSEAIESILSQSFTDFELLIINDGSTDNSKAIIQSYSDPRIVYVENPTNLKLIATLNKGLQIAKGKYIVRMDADDISLPTRIERQVLFMEKEPDIGVAGTWVIAIDSEEYPVKYESDSDNIKIRMLLSCHLNHPSTIIRTAIIKQFHLEYPTAHIHAEDYALWLKVLEVSKIGMIEEYLLKYRVHNDKIGTLHYDTQWQQSFELRRQQLAKLTPVSNEEFRLFNSFIYHTTPEHFVYPEPSTFRNANEFLILGAFLKRVIAANERLGIYNPQKFSSFLSEKWKYFCLGHTSSGIKVYQSFFKYSFQEYSPIPPLTRCLFFLKACFKVSPIRKLAAVE